MAAWSAWRRSPVAGVAGYTVAIFGTNNIRRPWLRLAVVGAGAVRGTLGALGFRRSSAAISVRTEGIYTIMITLAIATALLLLRAAELLAVQRPFRLSPAFATPSVCGVNWRDSGAVLLSLSGRGGACYAAVLYCSRSTFGLALQAIRDNPRRMRALGFDVTAHKVAAYFYCRHHRRARRRAAGLVQRPHLAGHDRRRRRRSTSWSSP